jgi:hypothetical protein
MAHTDLYLLKKLIGLLDYTCNDIYVHIDRKSDIQEEDIKNIVYHSDIYVYRNIKVYWGHYSQVECELFLLDKSLPKGYSYYHLLSGSDLPLQMPSKIYHFFESSGNKEFLHFTGDTLPRYIIDRIEYFHFLQRYIKISQNRYVSYIISFIEHLLIFFQKIIRIKRIDALLKFQKGSNWFSITEEFALYVIKNKPWIKKTFMYSNCADEMFMQTLLVNSDFAHDVFYDKKDDNYYACQRFIDWKRGKPYVFKEDDFDMLINSGYLFARKFDTNIDKKIIDKIYNLLKSC